jgi:hypothetical protein
MVLGASKSMASNFKPRQEPHRANGQAADGLRRAPAAGKSANHRQPRSRPAAFNASCRCALPKPTNWHTCAPLQESTSMLVGQKPVEGFGVGNLSPNYPREHSRKLIVFLFGKLTIKIDLSHLSSQTDVPRTGSDPIIPDIGRFPAQPRPVPARCAPRPQIAAFQFSPSCCKGITSFFL